ncbi:major capsid protein [Escherichia phage CR01]|nr:major capsid protein [Escherichia phage CR01]
MAITTIGDIVTGNIPVLASYMTEDPVEKPRSSSLVF